MNSFANWCHQNPYIEDYIYYPNGEDCRWARLTGKWKEDKGDKELHHLVAFTVDQYTGDIYLDCTERKIWAKCLGLIILCPSKGIIRTAYHLALPLSIPMAIAGTIISGIQKQHTWSKIAYESLRNSARNVADIFRTPFYTVVLTITIISAVVMGLYKAALLYDMRMIIGKIDRYMNWDEGSRLWTNARCFSPYDNIMTINPVDDENHIIGSLNEFAFDIVLFWRNNRWLFNNCFQLLDDDTAYVSAAYTEWEAAQ